MIGYFPQRNTPIIDHLLKAGMTVTGKANLSEMSGWKGFGITTGWPPVGGQTQSPCIFGGLAEGEKLLGQTALVGSSSGSASGVAAGFAPLAVATEIDGSITQPANRAALFGIKVTVGRASIEGTAPWSALTDSVGGMAKSAQDLADLVDVILGTNTTSTLNTSWQGQTIGFVGDTCSLGIFRLYLYSRFCAHYPTTRSFHGYQEKAH